MTVKSEVGRGSTFCVEIPKGFTHLPADAVVQTPIPVQTVAAASVGVAAHATEAANWVGGAARVAMVETPAATDPGRQASAHVLVVDDNADLRGYLSGLLAPVYDVTTATDGLSALELIRLHQFDIVVSDVLLNTGEGQITISNLPDRPGGQRVRARVSIGLSLRRPWHRRPPPL